MKILGNTPDGIICPTEKAFKIAQQILNVKSEGVGYLTILDALTGQSMLIAQIECYRDEKAAEYLAESQNNAVKLFKMEDDDPENWRRTRNPCGAIRVKSNTILSFSGLTEEANEAICLCIAVWFGWTSQNKALEIAKNQEYVKIISAELWKQG